MLDLLNNDTALLVSLFVSVTILSAVVLWAFTRRRRSVEQRLQAIVDSDSSDGSSQTMLLGDLTPALAAQVPVSEGTRGELQRELRVAGYYRPSAVMEYAALRAVFVIVPLILAGAVALVTETTMQAVWVWIGGVLVAMLGYSLPRIYVYYRGQERMAQIERGLPTAIDMLTLCLSAGLNVLTSLDRVVRELALAFPVIAYEFAIVRRQAELRSLEFALAQFADRVGLPHARNLAVILTQSENLGTDAVATLREYADNMRFNLRQHAEETANKVPFKMLFPAYLLAFGAAILLLSPSILEFSSFRKSNMIGGDITKARNLLRGVPNNPPPAEGEAQP